MIKLKPPYDANSKESLQQRHLDYNVVYNMPEGKRVIDDIMYYSAIDRTAYCSKSDTQTTFNLGKQSMGYHIVNVLTQPYSQPQQKTNEENND